MKSFDFKKVLKILGNILRCPICGFDYNLDTMRVVESEHDELTGEARVLIYSDCKKCKGSVVFSIGFAGNELYSAASVTDLTFADTRKFEKVPALSTEDCMAIHREVRGLDENFFKSLVKSGVETSADTSLGLV